MIAFVVIVLLIVLGIDFYAFKALLISVSSWTPFWKKILVYIYWIFSGFILIGSLLIAMNASWARKPENTVWFSLIMGLLITSVVTKLFIGVFHLIDDIGYLARTFVLKQDIESRRAFLTQTGIVLAAIPFGTFLYGITKGKYDFKVRKKVLEFPDLPHSFSGLKIVQISDMHLGSFGQDFSSVMKGIEIINSLEPDYIFFTGDMVNNYANETSGWKPYLSQLNAKYGKYSILGNHDYGDYSSWQSEKDKAENLSKLEEFHREINFTLLKNENVYLNIEGDKIALIGMENWGEGRFSKYGDIKKALEGIKDEDFQIMLSHDPSHWDAQVLNKTKVNLSLAGHTHGMQFGVNLGRFKYSPAQHRYPRWGGLYSENNQHLYVNRGFGFIGFPGRVGMPPEITLLELKTVNKSVDNH